MGFKFNPITGQLDLVASGSGDVVGPASSTDNGLPRFDTTTGKILQTSTASIDDTGNLTLVPASGIAETSGGVNLSHTNGTGTSQYRVSQDNGDILNVKRTGDTTGDGAVFSIVNIISPSALTSGDSEATLSLSTRTTGTGSVTRTLDLYNDEYGADNGMGFRQLYKNTTPNPIRFESHNKTTSNGAWTMTGVSVTSGSPNGSYTSVSGVTPSAEDWVWDNALAYVGDDTKILSINTSAKTFVLNRNAIGTGSGLSIRGKCVRETARLTPDRQLLVRKFLGSLPTSNVAEFGGQIQVDGKIVGVTNPTNPQDAATKSYVDTSVSNLVASSPSTLDTLNELAAALGNDPNFATSTTTAIGGKEPSIASGTAAQYWRGDKSWQTLNKAAVGLSSVDNTSDTNKPISTLQQAALDAKLGFTAWQTWTPTFTGFATDPTGGIYRYRTVGDEIEVEIRQPNDGTSSLATFTISLPVQAATVTDMVWQAMCRVRNNSIFVAAPGYANINAGDTVMSIFINTGTTAWGTTNGKRVDYLRMKYKF